MSEVSQEKIYGILQTVTVELPYETPEKAAEAVNQNAAMAHLGFRTFRAAYDYGYTSYEKLSVLKPLQKQLPSPDAPAPASGNSLEYEKSAIFKTGDLVRIFKTVTVGNVLWDSAVNYDNTVYHHGLQKGFEPSRWADMFYAQLPAKLQSDGEVIYGALNPFCETGTEGVIWSVQEYGKNGYDGLHCLKQGDGLTVYKHVSDGAVDWEGPAVFGPVSPFRAQWWEVNRQSLHMDSQKFLQLCFQNRPVIVTPGKPTLES